MIMGRQQFDRCGYGMTKAEAERFAIDDACSERGHEEGYSGDMNCADTWESECLEKPQPAKKCTVEKDVQKGARKWETVYVIDGRFGFGISKGNSVVKGTQADAIKRAKELALRDNQEYTISIEKHLVTGGSRIATVKPKAAKRGKWRFWGWGRS
jgi:hypothetical protein